MPNDVRALRPEMALVGYDAEPSEVLPQRVGPLDPTPSISTAAVIAESGYVPGKFSDTDTALLPAPLVEAGESDADAEWDRIQPLLRMVGQAPPDVVAGSESAQGMSPPQGVGKLAGRLNGNEAEGSGGVLSSLAGNANSMADFIHANLPLLSMQLLWCFNHQKQLGIEIRADQATIEMIQQAEKSSRLEQIERDRQHFAKSQEINEKAQKGGILQGVLNIFSGVAEIATGIGMVVTGNPLAAPHLALGFMQVVSGGLQIAAAKDPELREKLEPVIAKLNEAIFAMTIVTTVLGIGQFLRLLRPTNIVSNAAKTAASSIENIGEVAAKSASKSIGQDTVRQISAQVGEMAAEQSQSQLTKMIGKTPMGKFFFAYFGKEEVAKAASAGVEAAIKRVGAHAAKETAEIFSERLIKEIGTQVAKAMRGNLSRAMRVVNAAITISSIATSVTVHFMEAALAAKRGELKNELNDLEAKSMIFAIHVTIFAELLKHVDERRDKKLEQYQKAARTAHASVERQNRIESMLIGAQA